MRTILIFIALTAFYSYTFGREFHSLQRKIHTLEKEYAKTKKLRILLELNDKYNLNSQYVKGLNSLKKRQTDFPNSGLREKSLLHLACAKSYKYQGKVDEATRCFLEARKGFVRLNDFQNLLRTGIEIIEFNRKITKHDQAEKEFFYFVHFAKKKKITTPEIWIGLYNRYAAVLNETNRPYASLKYSNKALALAEKLNDGNLNAISYNEKGFSYKNLKITDSCETNYQKAATSWMNKGYYRDGIHAKVNLLTFQMHNQLIKRDDEINELYKLIKEIDLHNVDYPKSVIYNLIRSHYFFVGEYKKVINIDDSLNYHLGVELGKRDKLKAEEISEQFKNEELQKENEFKATELSSSKKMTWLVSGTLAIVLTALFGILHLWYKLRVAHKLLIKRNEQKTILVQEIHHRVKNNLQFVRSMLEMQTDNMESVEGSENLTDVSRRIDAMSLVHEMLYIEEDSMGISVKHYLEQLIDLSSNLYSENNSIRFLLAVEDIEMPIDKVVSIGIICSELVTNSVKHAFTNSQNPTVSIELKKHSESTFELVVCDNGTESSTASENKRYNLGMRLIDIFARQLNGKYSISKENGYEFRIVFSLSAKDLKQ